MSLQSGTRLGPYEILSPLGAGGMGEVYRAKDTRLERTVAIKVLPSHLSSNADLRQRFEREAKLISNLSHPHICTLHDIGHQDGIDYLVMEHLEGETLADRLSKGALPLDQALRYGIEICDALDKAHRQGIVHRDLKPGNIMLTKSGVKLLDFGLAKLHAPDEIKEVASVSALNTEVRELTAEGTILGTIQYMAPEQLEGKPTDTRTDIFAVGTVMYEMVSGKKAFEGKSRISLIAAILEKEPIPISTLQPLAPPLLERLIKTCLAKDPDSRWQNAHDVAEELKWLTDRDSQSGATLGRPTGGKIRERIAWILAAIFLLSAILLATRAFRTPQSAAVIYSSIELPRDHDLLLNDGALALSPDGQKLVFCTIDREGKAQLWLRLMNGTTATRMAVGDHPFWSPDSRFVGFFTDDGKLKKLDTTTGAVQTICDALRGRGGTWNQRGTIVFSPGISTGLYQVSASGGKAVQITSVSEECTDQCTHRFPHFLPDGRHLFFWYGSLSKENTGIYLLDVETGKMSLVAKELSDGWYAEPGYLLFMHDGNLMAQPFDLKELHTTGDPISLAEDVQYSSYRSLGMFCISQNGMLLYRPFSTIQKQLLTWFDREGKAVGTIGEPAVIQDLRIAPDGQRVMVALTDKSSRINYWIYDPQNPTETRFTFNSGPDCCIAWSPDGKYAVYQSYEIGSPGFYLKAVDGSSPPQLLSGFGTAQPSDLSPDGRTVAFSTDLGQQDSNMWLMNMTGDRKPYRFLQSQANEQWGRFSPDGQWFSYISNESGKPELYVVPFPGPGGKWQISSGGATNSWWVNNGKEIIYWASERKFISVEVGTKNGRIEIGKQSSIPINFLNSSEELGDFTPDGKHFLQPVPEENFIASLTLVTNWTTLLKKN